MQEKLKSKVKSGNSKQDKKIFSINLGRNLSG